MQKVQTFGIEFRREHNDPDDVAAGAGDAFRKTRNNRVLSDKRADRLADRSSAGGCRRIEREVYSEIASCYHLRCTLGGSGCSRKNRTISPVASGPRGRV